MDSFSKNIYYILGFIFVTLLSTGIALRYIVNDVNKNYFPDKDMSATSVEADSLSSHYVSINKKEYFPAASTKGCIRPISDRKGSYYLFLDNPKLLMWLLFISLYLGLSVGFILVSIGLIFKQPQRLLYKKLFKPLDVWILSISLGIVGVALFSTGKGNDALFSRYLIDFTDILQHFDLFFDNPHIVLGRVVLIPSIAGILTVLNIYISVILIMRFFQVKDKAYQVLKGKENKAAFVYNTDTRNWMKDTSAITAFRNTTIKELKSFKNNLDFNFTILGGLIALGIFTTGLLRLSIIEAICYYPESCRLIPIDIVYIYGLSFTAILAIIYYPIFYFFKNIANHWINHHVSEGDKQEALKKELKIIRSSTENFTDILKLSSPLIASIFTDVLNYF